MYSKVKVIGKNVNIKVVDVIENDESTLGLWVGTERTIYLKRVQPYIHESLLHELIEAIKDECDLQMNHQTLSTLSVAIFQVLKEHPGILENEIRPISESTEK